MAMRAFPSAVSLSLVAVVAVAGCSKFIHNDAAGDAAADGGPPAVELAVVDAATARIGATEAKNIDQITRFPNEVKLASELAKLERATTSVREDPPSGKVFAVLPKGTDVVKLASHEPFVLIAFASPQDPSEHLAGWVNKDSFVASNVIAKPAPALKCAAGQTMLWGDPPFCDKLCTAQVDCGEHQFCSGVAPLFGTGAVPGKAVKFCVGENTSASKDGGPGATATSDASAPAPAAVDGGAAAAVVTSDAGAAATHRLGALLEKAQNGICPAGKVLVDIYCRIPCSTDAECPGAPRSKCGLKNGIKVCSAAKLSL